MQVQLGESDTIKEGKKIAQDLMEKLDVSETDLISVAYIDMILDKMNNWRHTDLGNLAGFCSIFFVYGVYMNVTHSLTHVISFPLLVFTRVVQKKAVVDWVIAHHVAPL